jgi:predicted acetyltransferase
MAIEIRNPSEDELRAAMRAGEAAFGEEHREEDFERHRKMLPLDRFYAAYDDGRPVGTTASFPFEVTIPGGVVPAAGVTWVAVTPTHRRRGILRDFMRRQLEDVHERGEPLAVLWASEAVIYGRFGYGVTTVNATLDVQQTDRMLFRDDPGRQGQVTLVDAKEALELFPPVRDSVRRETPGMFAVSTEWWQQYKLADPEHWRHGYSEKFYAALELDSSIQGYALYRIKQDWSDGIPQGELRVVDALATSADATRELWRFLFGIDVVRKARKDYFDPASPLFLLLEDPRRLRLRLSDGLWLRLVDVAQALQARSYATDDSVVIDVRDELMPWNEGRWRVGAESGRSEDEAELALNVRDLASVYLGGLDFHRLAAAARVEELKAGALERASALFRTDRPPHCPDEF